MGQVPGMEWEGDESLLGSPGHVEDRLREKLWREKPGLTPREMGTQEEMGWEAKVRFAWD